MSVCDNGWHVRGDPADPIFFRFAARNVYRIGPAPDDVVCRTIWCLGADHVPWTCVSCGQSIDGPLSPLSGLAKRRLDHGEEYPRRTSPPRTSRRIRPPFVIRLTGAHESRARRV
jgi:hypothetical protein